jgi:hypothetical protein
MNFLKKGPQLKLSEIRVPGFVQDVYYDLKDRHLLPVAAILLVAIVAVPIALSQSSNSGESGSSEAALGTTQSSGGAPSGELVAKSSPGLRDYRRRLAHRRASNPFKQQFDGEESSSSEGAGTAESEGSTSPSSPEGSAAPAETLPGPETGPEPEGPHLVPGKLRYYSYAIDVRVSAAGSQAGGSSSPDSKATVRRDLPELTMLPSRETPAIIYMGSTKDGKKALMVVSSDVDAIFGDAKCVLGSETCEMLAMEPELPETFVYGGSGRTYKIELLKIHLVETNKLNRAPLGKPKKGKSSKGNG